VDYDIALFLHIAGVLALVVASALELTSLMRLRRSTSVAEARTWASLSAPLQTVFPVSAIFIVATGLYMLHSGFASAQPWALTVLVILVLLAIAGAAFNGRNMMAIHEALRRAPEGRIPGEIVRRIHNPALLTSIQSMSVMILGAVLLMTVKPGLLDSLIIAVVFGVLGVASAQLVLRAKAGRAPNASDVELSAP
jgi:hypothetical protein